MICRRPYAFVEVIISFRWHLIRKEDERNVEIPTARLKLGGRGIDKTTQSDKTRFSSTESPGACMRAKQRYGKGEGG